MFDIALSTLLQNLLKLTPKINYFERLQLGASFFDISKYLKDNFLHGLGVPTPK